MELLSRLFPGLSDFEDEGIPSWDGFNYPWEILSSDENGLIAQIEVIVGENGIFIHDSAEIGDSVSIEGPCYIGPRAEIRHSAYLRRGCWICQDTVVGHSSEVKNSILLPFSKAPHFNYVGDSILGLGVNLGAGVKLSNVRNDRGEIPIITMEGDRMGSGMKKLGALIGDESQLGCNVVTNPGAIISPGIMIGPNETVSGWRT